MINYGRIRSRWKNTLIHFFHLLQCNHGSKMINYGRIRSLWKNTLIHFFHLLQCNHGSKKINYGRIRSSWKNTLIHLFHLLQCNHGSKKINYGRIRSLWKNTLIHLLQCNHGSKKNKLWPNPKLMKKHFNSFFFICFSVIMVQKRINYGRIRSWWKNTFIHLLQCNHSSKINYSYTMEHRQW